MARDLTALQRKTLKARAHALHPVVVIGDKGLTDAVLHEIDVNLRSHELIKIRVAGGQREHREAMLAAICTRLAALPVQHIGRVLVVYREQPKPAQDSAARQTEPARRTVIPARQPGRQARPPRARVRRQHSAAATLPAPRARTR